MNTTTNITTIITSPFMNIWSRRTMRPEAKKTAKTSVSAAFKRALSELRSRTTAQPTKASTAAPRTETARVQAERTHVYATASHATTTRGGRAVSVSTYIASPYLIASTYTSTATVACHSHEGGNLVAQDGSSASSEGGTPASDDPDERQTQQNTSKTLSIVLGYFVRSLCSVILTKEGWQRGLHSRRSRHQSWSLGGVPLYHEQAQGLTR
jgi:hypothetical protein